MIVVLCPHFQKMYCSENCRHDDWSSVHSHICGKALLDQCSVTASGSTKFVPFGIQELLNRLIVLIGVETIQTIAVQDKPIKSLLGDQRTKGFHGGKFEAITLESVLSLVDNCDKLSVEERLEDSIVIIIIYLNYTSMNNLFKSLKFIITMGEVSRQISCP